MNVLKQADWGKRCYHSRRQVFPVTRRAYQERLNLCRLHRKRREVTCERK